MNSSSCPRWLRFAAAATACLACALLGASLRPASANLHALERELALAVEAREPGAVRELTQRFARLDDSPERRLHAAKIFLQLGLPDELERALGKIGPTSAAKKLRAQAAMGRGDWASAVPAWENYLAPAAGLTAPERVAALDELARAHVATAAWAQAIARLDERIALADAVAPRLVRSTALVQVRRWNDARGDFAHLRRVASDDAAVKSLLPGWERVERALPDLVAADALTADAPEPLLDRGLVTLRAGLWQNAVEDFSAVVRTWPELRTAPALIAVLGSRGENRRVRAWRDFGAETFPVFAPGESVLALAADLDADRAVWDALRACDREIAAAGVTPPRLRAEQAKLLCGLGFPWRALEDARRALRESPHLLAAARVEIAALLALQRGAEADDAVAHALRQHPSAGTAIDGELAYLAGLVWQMQGKHGEAVAMFTLGLGMQRSGEVLCARARSLRFLQRFAESADDLAAAAGLEAALAGKSQ